MIDSSLSRRSFIARTAAIAGLAALGDLAVVRPDTAKAAGGTLTATCAYSSTNYSPVGCSSALMLGATWHVFEGLYDLDLHTYETYPALANGDPTKVSDTEYEVTLRDGAKFSDGTDVTAKDVVNAFEKNMANDTYGAFLSFIDSVTAKDDKTVSIKLKYAFDSLLKGRLAVVKVFPASLSDDALATSPIGSGPWMYTSINGDDGGSIEFEPNPNYNGPYPAKADKMHWDVQKDGTSRTVALQGMTSMVMEAVPDANVDALKSAGATVEYKQGFSLPFLMFNTKKAPFDDNRVRQAFLYAINVPQLISNAMMDKAEAATSFLPASHANYHEASTVYTYDTAKATELLQEAGVSGLSITLDTTDANWITALSPQIKNDLEATGLVTVEIREQASSSLYANQTDTDDPQFDVVLAPGDPSVFGNDPDLLMNWWYGDNTWTQKRTQWKGSEAYEQLQTLMNQAVQASGDEQQELWNQCFDLIAEQAPLYPLFHRSVTTAYYADQLDGYEPIGTTGLNFIDVTAQA